MKTPRSAQKESANLRRLLRRLAALRDDLLDRPPGPDRAAKFEEFARIAWKIADFGDRGDRA